MSKCSQVGARNATSAAESRTNRIEVILSS
jgi:hypothetical protein